MAVVIWRIVNTVDNASTASWWTTWTATATTTAAEEEEGSIITRTRITTTSSTSNTRRRPRASSRRVVITRCLTTTQTPAPTSASAPAAAADPRPGRKDEVRHRRDEFARLLDEHEQVVRELRRIESSGELHSLVETSSSGRTEEAPSLGLKQEE
ncbi:hypothetical protein DAPPUDRAFT_106480 [Daphnia pulex]|uniref:Uncharacterized protein n=1 Tax=Daphnia pulex TaxID=6669 RepID=E9GTW9_DAPPU|nr:hypothetical protein DAPPUDRAFT_106480 [Daphnia pulex]|eukprot:EFX76931.1 hypothetical protein DAPPUDRAFT_106480 [Daphnia pulex]